MDSTTNTTTQEKTENASFLQEMPTNDRLIAEGYLDFFTYVYFLVSVILLVVVLFLKTPPFDNKLVKSIVLFLISLIGMLLFFKLYSYILIILIFTIAMSLFKVRDEIKQYFLIKNYHKKELGIDLNDGDFETNVMIGESDDDIYNKIGLVQFFNQLFSLFSGIKNLLSEKSEGFHIFLMIFYIFSFIMVLGYSYLFFQLFQTDYIFISR